MGANWMEEQEMNQIQFRERYGGADGLCYEHRRSARPWLATPCWWNVISESLSKSKMVRRKSKEQIMLRPVLTILFYSSYSHTLNSLLTRDHGKEKKRSNFRDVQSVCLSFMRMKWNTGWLPGIGTFLKWYELPFHQGQIIIAMTGKVDRSPAMTTQSLQRLSYILDCVSMHQKQHPLCNLKI